MLKKHGKYFADWFDTEGHRRRKAFATAKEARQFQQQQRQQVEAAKKARPRRRSHK